MHALSLQQPWAQAVTYGLRDRTFDDLVVWKGVENRTWWRRHEGPLFIHASKTYDHAGAEQLAEFFPEAHIPTQEECQRCNLLGAIVGAVNVSGWTNRAEDIDERDRRLYFGPYAFVLRDPHWLAGELAVPLRGMPSLFKIPSSGNGLSASNRERLTELWLHLLDHWELHDPSRSPHLYEGAPR